VFLFGNFTIACSNSVGRVGQVVTCPTSWATGLPDLDLIDENWWLEHGFYHFPYVGNVIIPTDEVHHFSEG